MYFLSIIVAYYSNNFEFYLNFCRICVLMAEQAISLRDNQQAIAHYKEAMKFAQGDHLIMGAYARLCMQVKNE